MYSRRAFVMSTALSIAAAGGAQAQDACAVFTPARQNATTPQDALRLLQEGNAALRLGQDRQLRSDETGTRDVERPGAVRRDRRLHRQPRAARAGVRPALGSIFAARIAGNFVNTDIIGSLEFSCKLAGAKAIVVLGHSECGAIKGAIDQAKLGNLTEMLSHIEPAVAATKFEGKRTSKDKKLVQAVADTNAQLAARMILSRSPVLKEMADKKEIVVAAAMHDIETGRVSFFT